MEYNNMSMEQITLQQQIFNATAKKPKPSQSQGIGDGEYEKIYNMYMNYYRHLAYSRFSWNGEDLPKEINSMMIEQFLFDRGYAGFGYDKVVEKYYILPIASIDGIDEYGFQIPNSLLSLAGETINTDDDTILITNNLEQYYDIYSALRIFVTDLSVAHMSQRVNMFQMRMPFVINSGDEKGKGNVQDLIDFMKGFIPFVSLKKDVRSNRTLEIEKTDIKPFFQEFENQKKTINGKILTMLGIDNSFVSKAERVISNETTGNDAETEMNLKNALDARKFACERINEKFGLHLFVEYNTQLSSNIAKNLGGSAENENNKEMESDKNAESEN